MLCVEKPAFELVLEGCDNSMMEALVAGITDPNELAEPARGRLRSKLPAL
jgi:hypothetical protein